jgi:hypothetical protein
MLKKKFQPLLRMRQLFAKKQSAGQLFQKPMPSLGACLVMDILGSATYAIPVLGEFLDVLWAPLSAFMFFRMFGGTRGLFGGAFNLFEELMPGLDFIPTFTIAWFMQYAQRRKNTITITPATR